MQEASGLVSDAFLFINLKLPSLLYFRKNVCIINCNVLRNLCNDCLLCLAFLLKGEIDKVKYSYNNLTSEKVIKMTVKLKRIYEDKEESDGKRILVDRLWPRGVSKEDAHLDEWMKEIGPSNELRKWFAHDDEKFDGFKHKYKQELQDGKQKASYDQLKAIQKENKVITLLYSAKNKEYNQAQVLKDMLETH